MVHELSPCGACEGRGCDDCVDGQICAWCGVGANAIDAACDCCVDCGAPKHMACDAGCPSDGGADRGGHIDARSFARFDLGSERAA